MPEIEYIVGHSERELRRLMLQSSVLRPITERHLHGAGIRSGMRVLDLGCGVGDVYAAPHQGGGLDRGHSRFRNIRRTPCHVIRLPRLSSHGIPPSLVSQHLSYSINR